MIGWRKNSWNPERVSSVFTFVSVCLCVCLSVCTRATEHTFWHRNLIFWWNDPWDMRKKTFFFCFSKFSCLSFFLKRGNSSTFLRNLSHTVPMTTYRHACIPSHFAMSNGRTESWYFQFQETRCRLVNNVCPQGTCGDSNYTFSGFNEDISMRCAAKLFQSRENVFLWRHLFENILLPIIDLFLKPWV